MNGRQAILVFFAVLIGTINLRAQDVAFSQFYSNPIYLNPAFAGSIGVPRLVTQYRNQWPGFDKAFNTYAMGFDLPVKALEGGLGFLLLNDAQGNSALKSLQFDVMYTKFTRLNKNFSMNGSIQAGLHRNSLDWSKLIFPDNLILDYGNPGVTQEVPVSDRNYNYFDVSAGILVYNNFMFLGLAGHHLNKPKQSFYQGQEQAGVLYRKYTLHFGSALGIYTHGQQRKTFDLLPQIVYQQQGGFRQFNYGISVDRRGLSTGVWFRQDMGLKYNALIFIIGFVKNSWQLTYSYDWVVSGLSGLTGGSSEITLSFLLKKPVQPSSYPFYRFPEEY